MVSRLQPLGQLLVYGHFWIALAAVALAAQTQWLLSGKIASPPLLLFLGSGTLFIYTLHRLFGLARIPHLQAPPRYLPIIKLQPILPFLAVGAAAAAALAAWLLPRYLYLYLALPALLSLAYVLPVLPGGRRLRDLPYLKIFLVAIAWSWLTVVVPARHLGLHHTWPAWLMAAERGLFIFALTLPFDIRDQHLDRSHGVPTLPSRLGPHTTHYLAASLLLLMLALAGLNTWFGAYRSAQWLALALSATVTFALIRAAHPHKPDTYFSGWLDGMMVLQAILLCCA